MLAQFKSYNICLRNYSSYFFSSLGNQHTENKSQGPSQLSDAVRKCFMMKYDLVGTNYQRKRRYEVSVVGI